MVTIKRVYETPSKSDGYRVLVDRLWPRGLTKEAAAVDLWLKEIAPSAELRTWFGHDPAKFKEFTVRYKAELATNPAVKQLQELASGHPKLTLVYGAKDETANQAVVLQQLLQ